MTCVECLTGYLLGEQIQDAKVTELAGMAFADTVACIAAGLSEESTEIVRRYLKKRSTGVDAEDLALLYGTAAHVLDFDCQNHCVDGHDSVSVVSVILALAEEYPLTGKRALEIYGKAVDVDSYLGSGMKRENLRDGWNGTSMVSVLGCAAAAGLIMNLSAQQMNYALSLALLHAFGLTASFGYLSKDIVVGKTASTGIYCARMAAAGMNAPIDIVEKKNGYGNFFCGGVDVDKVKHCVESGVSSLVSPGLSYKLYPVCFSVQTGYQVIHKLQRKYSFSEDNIEKIVGTLQYDMGGVRDNPVPADAYCGKFDLRYCIALEVLNETVDMDTFSFGKECNAKAAGLCRKIELKVDEGKKVFDETCFCGVRLDIFLKTGEILSDQMSWPKGGYQSPMSREDFQKKLQSCFSRSLKEYERSSLIKMVNDLENVDAVSEITKFLKGNAG